ncbi:hypothetical protein GCM10027290_32270 [Micromonospora sonneratiae]|uniref:Uncharacterized protein n=1 Tax=Micromonospora sonneratiae TaxID=1184706 RepID=A0ABW3YCV3_9ACTN
MSGRFDVLRKAMQILGARSVTVFSIAPGSKVWSVAENRATIGDEPAAAAADVVATAQRLVELADPGSPLDEVFALDEAWFHVLYLLGSQETGPQVAHILLDRNLANLAEARREFLALVEAERAAQQDTEESGQRDADEPAQQDTDDSGQRDTDRSGQSMADRAVQPDTDQSAQDVPMLTPHEVQGASAEAEAAPSVAGRVDFPRRIATVRRKPQPLPGDGAPAGPTVWMNHLAGPFVSDEPTLRRVLDALRRL